MQKLDSLKQLAVLWLKIHICNSVVSGWVENAKSDKCPDLDGITDPYAIQPRSIGVYKGHALFIEWVDYDADGKPVTVYFTEENNGYDGKYRPEQDAK